jgi:hypothetical protein
MKAVLVVEVEGSTPKIVEDLIESLARVACDIVNSTMDDEAHIWITEMEHERKRLVEKQEQTT